MRKDTVKKLLTIVLTFICYMVVTPLWATPPVFPVSTEMQIGKIYHIVNRAPSGIYLTVGGERAFRGASMFDGLEHLVIFDISPDIVRYDKINVELLRSLNKEEYKHLRWESVFSEWKKISSNLSQEDFDWWLQFVRNNKGYELPEMLNRYGHFDKFIKIRSKLLAIYPKLSNKFNKREKVFLKHVSWPDIQNLQGDLKERLTEEEFKWFDAERSNETYYVYKVIEEPSSAVDWGQVIDFKTGNYLFDDKLYERLHNMVINNKITIMEADLTKREGVDSITNEIKKIGVKLTVLDLDNLYAYECMGEEKFRIAVSQLLKSGNNDSILILMHNYKDYPGAQFSIYLGFTFENVKSWPKSPFFDTFINALPKDIYPLLDGHLYEGKQELPFYLMNK